MFLLLLLLNYFAASAQIIRSSPSPTCIPTLYFYDGNADGQIDVDGSYYLGYFDFDNPGGNGDYEYTSQINTGQCPYALDTECVTTTGIQWNSIPVSPQYTINYDRYRGCECLNTPFNINGCVDANIDFTVRFLCPAMNGYFGCYPPVNYIPYNNPIASIAPTPSITGSSTSTVTTSPSGTRTAVVTSTRSVVATISRTTTISTTQTTGATQTTTTSSSITASLTCQPQRFFYDGDGDGMIDVDGSGWYGWYSIDGPDQGEYETIDYVNGLYNYSILSDLSFCPLPIDVECVEINSETPLSFYTNVITHIDPHWGCWCNTWDNQRGLGPCFNIKIRYRCPSVPGYIGCSPPPKYIPETALLGSYSPSPDPTSYSPLESISPTSSASPLATASSSPLGTTSGSPLATASRSSLATTSSSPLATASGSSSGSSLATTSWSPLATTSEISSITSLLISSSVSSVITISNEIFLSHPVSTLENISMSPLEIVSETTSVTASALRISSLYMKTISATRSNTLIFSINDIDNLINNGYTIFYNNNTVYLHGNYAGYIVDAVEQEQISSANNKSVPSSAIAGIISSLSVLGILAILASVVTIHKRRNSKELPNTRPSMMKDVSFDNYINDFQTPTQPGNSTNQLLSSRRTSMEFVTNPQRSAIPNTNRLSTTLYQAKVKPLKKLMMPIMSQNVQGHHHNLSHLRLNT